MDYTVKCFTFPDLTKQVRIYSRGICSPSKVPVPPARCDNPFDNHKGRDLKEYQTFDDLHVSDVSVKRTRSKVYMYARSNVWDWFVTFTFAPDKVDRFDYDLCSKKLSEWLKNLRRISPGLSYIVVPERHDNGAWHFHGLFAGLPPDELVWSGKYVVRKYMKDGRAHYRMSKDKIYRFGHYRFGWMTATAVKETERVTSYITKYITKDMLAGLFGRKRYWASRNLLLPNEEVYQLDEVDRFILADELSQDCSFSKVCTASYGEMTQSVQIFEL